jgi:RNA polymerase sigma factor (sigma-70 family)
VHRPVEGGLNQQGASARVLRKVTPVKLRSPPTENPLAVIVVAEDLDPNVPIRPVNRATPTCSRHHQSTAAPDEQERSRFSDGGAHFEPATPAEETAVRQPVDGTLAPAGHSFGHSFGHSLGSAMVPALVEAARDGDPGAWGELVARFDGMIAATGRRYRLTPADVAELQQTTWLRLVENIHRVEQPERVGGWLATTARRESLLLLKRAEKYRSGADQILVNMPDKHLPDPDARSIARERDAVVQAAWEHLKPRCQELLSLLVADDPLGYKHLSDLLQMPIGSIGPTRARCLEHLRRLIEEQGLSAA